MNYHLVEDWQATVRALLKEIERLERENNKLKTNLEKERKKNKSAINFLDEPLNTGNGTYKP